MLWLQTHILIPETDQLQKTDTRNRVEQKAGIQLRANRFPQSIIHLSGTVFTWLIFNQTVHLWCFGKVATTDSLNKNKLEISDAKHSFRISPKTPVLCPPLWGDSLCHTTTASPPLHHLQPHQTSMLTWRFQGEEKLSANRSIDHDVLSSLTNVKNKFLKYYHRKLRLKKDIVTFQQMKRELLGFWQLRLAKWKDLSVLQHLPNGHIENHGHDTQYCGQLLEQAHTQSWQETGTRGFTKTCWEALFWVFSLGGFT